jgi:hypothetical protein
MRNDNLTLAEVDHARNCAIKLRLVTRPNPKANSRGTVIAVLREGDMKPETQKLIVARLRAELEDRLARTLKIDQAELPPLSMEANRIQGTSSFSDKFSSGGPHDSKGAARSGSSISNTASCATPAAT